MNKKILNFFLCGAMFIASAGMFVSCSDYDDDIKDLNQKIENLDKSLSGQIETKIQAVNTTIQGLQAQLDKVDEAYKAADAELKAAAEKAQGKADDAYLKAEANAADIKALKDELETAIADLKGTLEDLEKKHDKDVKDLIAKDAELNEAIIAAQTKAEAAFALATANEGRLNGVDEEIKKINETLKSLQDQITTLGNDLKAAVKRIEANEAEIIAINGRADVLKGRVDAIQNDSIKAVRESIAKLDKDLRALIDQEVGKVQAALEDSCENINLRIDAVEEAYKNADLDLQNQIDEINTLLDDEIQPAIDELNAEMIKANANIQTLANLLSGMITGIIYQGQGYSNINSKNDWAPDTTFEFPVYYGKVGANVTFPDATSEQKDYEGKITLQKDRFIVSATSTRLYATVNPGSVDFSGKTLDLVDSEDEANPFFALGQLVKCNNHKLTMSEAYPTPTRSGAAEANGFYAMDVKYVGDGMSAPNNEYVYALATSQNQTAGEVDEDGNLQTKYSTVTSKYAIQIATEDCTDDVVANGFDIVAYDKAGQLVTTGNAKINSKYEFTFNATDTEFPGYLAAKLFNNQVYKFYIEYGDTCFAEGNAYQKVYDGKDINNKFKFTCKSEYLNKPLTITYVVLNYNGTVTKSTVVISYTKALIDAKTLNITVAPGHKQNFNGDSAIVCLSDSLLKSLTDAEKALLKKNATQQNVTTTTNYGTDKAFKQFSLEFPTNTTDYKFVAEYDPAKVKISRPSDKNPNINELKWTILDKDDHVVVNVTAKIAVVTPNHLDSFIANGANRKQTAFGFEPKNGEKFGADEAVVWASKNGTQNNGIFTTLKFAMSNVIAIPYVTNQGGYSYDGILKDAETAGFYGWKLSNDSKLIVSAKDLTIGSEYYATTSNKNIYTFGDAVTSEGNAGTKKFDVKQQVNYYQVNRTDPYLGDSANFTLMVVSPINYGIYDKIKLQEISDTVKLSADNVTKKEPQVYTVTLPLSTWNSIEFPDYITAADATFTLAGELIWGNPNIPFNADRRIRSISFSMPKDAPYANEIVNFSQNDNNEITFDINIGAMNSMIATLVNVTVTDVWGVKTTFPVTLVLDLSSLEKK